MFNFYQIQYRGHLELAISMILLLSCIYTFIELSLVTCIEENCINLTRSSIIKMFPRTVAVACVISKITSMYNNKSAFLVYEKKIERYEFYFPTHVCKKNCRRTFTIITIFLCIVIILPINALRLYLFYTQNQDYNAIMMFTFMYVQNAYICMIELEFITLGFGLYQKFQSINEDMCVLKSKSIVTNRYPWVLKPEPFGSDDSVGSAGLNDENIFSTSTKEFSLANTVELLRTRHKFVSNLINDLNNLYNVQLALSLSILFIMALLDIYEVLFTRLTITRSHIILLSGWLLQYSFRFCMIILIPHATTKQVRYY